MLAMKLRFYVYLVIGVAAAFMLALDPNLLAASGIPAALASLVSLWQQLVALVR